MSNKINEKITKGTNFVVGLVCIFVSFISIYNFIKYGDANYMKWGEAKGILGYIYIGFWSITGCSLIYSSLNRKLKNGDISKFNKRF
jgi:hypothetical protein